MQSTEIEFKNLLTESEYRLLMNHFQFSDEEILRQENYYFDSPNRDLQKQKMGFRMRIKGQTAELTLKRQGTSENMMIETNVALSWGEAMTIQRTGTFDTSNYVEFLDLPSPLTCWGSLITERAERKTLDGIWVLDHSFYGQMEDYELEYEVIHEETGRKHFDSLLEEFHIPKRATPKKIARLHSSLN